MSNEGLLTKLRLQHLAQKFRALSLGNRKRIIILASYFLMLGLVFSLSYLDSIGDLAAAKAVGPAPSAHTGITRAQGADDDSTTWVQFFFIVLIVLGGTYQRLKAGRINHAIPLLKAPPRDPISLEVGVNPAKAFETVLVITQFLGWRVEAIDAKNAAVVVAPVMPGSNPWLLPVHVTALSADRSLIQVGFEEVHFFVTRYYGHRRRTEFVALLNAKCASGSAAA